MTRALSPVLLLGAGTGEATCGILYLASFLRRHGVEAFVRLCDYDESTEELSRSVAQLLGRVRPRLVGISLKWYHHVARAELLARTVRAIDPDVRVVVGGNTAAWYREELLGAWAAVDDVIVGDGEGPLLALCRGEAMVPNRVRRLDAGGLEHAPLAYAVGEGDRDTFYSHFDELFLSELDAHGFSGWIAPGRGCGENCVYCGGRRSVQRLSFGRVGAFTRPERSVRRDHRELASRTWQLRYDFGGGSAAYLARVWRGFDLRRHATTYFLWGVPSRALIDALARTFERVFLVLDIGCFSQTQREALQRQGLLKPCPTDRQLLEAVDACRRARVELEVSGIAGLPFTSAGALAEERRLVERLLEHGCTVGFQRLQAQTGALVTEHAERFGMIAEAHTFDDFVRWFSRGDAAATAPVVPLVRFENPALERTVERACARVDEVLERGAAAKTPPLLDTTRLVATVAETRASTLGAWLGAHRVPRPVRGEPVTLVRSASGAGLACAPGLRPERLAEPTLQQGAVGAVVLEVLAAFGRPAGIGDALAALSARGVDADGAREVIAGLVAGQFLGAVRGA